MNQERDKIVDVSRREYSNFLKKTTELKFNYAK